MNKTRFTELKKDYINFVKKYTQEEGGMFPHISVFGDDEDDVAALVHIPIPDEYMVDDDGKDRFIEEVLPKLSEMLCKRFDIYGVAWSSEAWVRVASKKEEIEDYKSLPVKEEILMISIESDFENEFNVYRIKRKGSQVTTEGNIVDTIQLTKDRELSKINPKSEGRFVGLLNKIKKGGKDD